MRKFLLVCVVVLASSFSAKEAAAQNTAPTKLVVIPFQNTGHVRGQDYMQLQFAATLIERLETVPDYEVVSGLLVLTADIATLAPNRDKSGKMAEFDLAGANALAQSVGASFFITGHYSGSEWKWSLTAEVYAVQTNGPRLLSNATVNGDLTSIITVGGRSRSVVDIRDIHNLLSQAVSDAMIKANLPNAHLAKEVLQTPSTQDSWAFIQLGLAYAHYFSPVDTRRGRSTLDIAKYAVLVDPKYPEAQRFYSAMLEKQAKEKPENQGKILGIARLHYELALAILPNDTRTLIRLGQLELRQNNEDIAKGYLTRAVVIHPTDSEPHFWLAEVYQKLGDPKTAIAELERVRELSPARLDARRQLVLLYNQGLEYVKALTELRIITKTEPTDLRATFALPAVLRAMGENFAAAQAYTDAEQRFPNEPRFAKFRSDVLRADGGLFISVNAITKGKRLVIDVNEIRDIFGLAAGNTAMDFSLNGKDACADGRGSSAMLLAQEEERLHANQLQDLQKAADTIKTAFQQGDDAAFTSNERDDAEVLLKAFKVSERDNREMRAQMTLTNAPLMRKAGCENIDPSIRMASVEELEKQNEDWRVVMPDIKKTPSAPEIPTTSVRMIHFDVDNSFSRTDAYLTIDDKQFVVIPAGEKWEKLNTSQGNHNFCLLEKNQICGQPGTVRRTRFTDGIILLKR